MLPIGDQDVRKENVPLVTWALVGLNVIAFIYELTLSQAQLEQFFMNYGVVPARIQEGEQLIALLTSMFLHGGWAHIVGNMLFLLIFGDNVEATLGKLPYLIFYLAGGLVASGAHILLNANAELPSLGASGAVAAVLGAYLVMFPTSRVKVLVFVGYLATVTRVTAALFLGIWFVMQLFSGVASLGPETAQSGGVAYWAHVGGFVLGLGIGFLLRGEAPELAPERERRV